MRAIDFFEPSTGILMGWYIGAWHLRQERHGTHGKLIRRVALAAVLAMVLSAAVFAAGCTMERRAGGAPGVGPGIVTPSFPTPPDVTTAIPGALAPGSAADPVGTFRSPR